MDFGIFITVPTTVGATPKAGAANRWETTNSKPRDPIIMITQLETGTSTHIIFITLFFCGIN
jgi:hypothetical protein